MSEHHRWARRVPRLSPPYECRIWSHPTKVIGHVFQAVLASRGSSPEQCRAVVAEFRRSASGIQKTRLHGRRLDLPTCNIPNSDVEEWRHIRKTHRPGAPVSVPTPTGRIDNRAIGQAIRGEGDAGPIRCTGPEALRFDRRLTRCRPSVQRRKWTHRGSSYAAVRSIFPIWPWSNRPRLTLDQMDRKGPQRGVWLFWLGHQ